MEMTSLWIDDTEIPRLDSSVLQPSVRLVTTFAMDVLVQAPEEQNPVSQVLTVAGMEVAEDEELPIMEDMRPVGFKQAASGDVNKLSRELWHD